MSAASRSVEEMDWTEAERYAVAERMALFVVGGPERVRAQLPFGAITDAWGPRRVFLLASEVPAPRLAALWSAQRLAERGAGGAQ